MFYGFPLCELIELCFRRPGLPGLIGIFKGDWSPLLKEPIMLPLAVIDWTMPSPKYMFIAR
jgi:hypothetical protein